MPATDSPRPSRLKKPLPKPSDAAYVEASGGFEEAGVGVFGKGPHLQRHVLVEDATGSHPPA